MTDREINEQVTRQVRELLDCILGQLDFPGSDEMRQQARSVYVVGGPITMLDLCVKDPSPASEFREGPAPMSVTVTHTSGEAVGELLLWLKNGYISALEFAWWTNDPPARLPNLDRVLVTRR